MYFYGRMPVTFTDVVSLIFWVCWSWAVIYVGSLYVFVFWLLLGLSFVGPSFHLVNWVRVTPSTMSCILLCRCGQVMLKLVLLSVCGFEASLLLLFSCLFWVISPLFSCISNQSWIEVSVASTPFFTFFHCYLLVVPLLVGFLFQQVYWCSLLPPCKFSGVAKWNSSHCLSCWDVPYLELFWFFHSYRFYCLTVGKGERRKRKRRREERKKR